LRSLFRWAVNAEFVAADPTNGVNASRPRTEGFRAWTEDEIDRFESRWPTGSRERLALTILLYTGLRRGDAVQLGRQHIRDGVISMRTEKAGTPVTVPVLPELAEAIAAIKTGDLAFIATADDKRVVWKLVPRCVQGGRRPRLRAWAAQGRRDAGREQWRDRGAA
jgi:integrase